MTPYEYVSILIGILALLISFGCFIIGLLSFIDKRVKNFKKENVVEEIETVETFKRIKREKKE